MTAMGKREERWAKERAMNAGMIAAAVYNNNPNRRSGARMVKPSDFVGQETVVVSADELSETMGRWAETQNSQTVN